MGPASWCVCVWGGCRERGLAGRELEFGGECTRDGGDLAGATSHKTTTVAVKVKFSPSQSLGRTFFLCPCPQGQALLLATLEPGL